MAVIFLSYSRADRPRAEMIAHALEDEGLTVWWDKILKAGQTYDEVTEGMLRDASVVVVLWSEVSVKSKWVRTEATLGERTSTLIPAMIDDAERPIMFELTQSADLIGWDGDRTEARWQRFIADIKSAVASHGGAAPAEPMAVETVPSDPTSDLTMENTFWTTIQASTEASDYEAYLKRYPEGHFSDLARNRLTSLTPALTPEPEAPVAAPATKPTPKPAPKKPITSQDEKSSSSKLPLIIGAAALSLVAGYFVIQAMSGGGDQDSTETAETETTTTPGQFADCDTCPTMIALPGGAFQMGSPDTELGRTGNEGPLHTVTVQPFAISETEVTFDQWDACIADGGCSYSPSDHGFGRGGLPVLSISWQDAQSYTSWLSAKSGRAYRLPTEAEWEYAARAGTNTPYWWGASFDRSIAPMSAPRDAASLPANPFGVKGMLVNAREWVQDCYVNSYTAAPVDGTARTNGDCGRRVLRGGAWGRDPDDHRAANRARIDRNVRDKVFTIRLATSDLSEK